MKSLLPLLACVVIACLLIAADDAPPADKRELLSRHETVAKLQVIEDRKCMGLTTLCPDQCGHSGKFATFKIIAYIAYDKPGEYGDPKAETFTVQLSDNHGNPKLAKSIADTIGTLKPDQFARLDWNHDYVTRTDPGGGSSSFPERTITKLEPLTDAEAQKLSDGAKKE